MSNLVNDRLIDAVIDYVNEHPGSLYADILLRLKRENNYEGMWQLLKSARREDERWELQHDYPDTY